MTDATICKVETDGLMRGNAFGDVKMLPNPKVPGDAKTDCDEFADTVVVGAIETDCTALGKTDCGCGVEPNGVGMTVPRLDGPADADDDGGDNVVGVADVVLDRVADTGRLGLGVRVAESIDDADDVAVDVKLGKRLGEADGPLISV